MKDRPVASRSNQPREKKAGPTQKPSAPVYGLRMKPRRRLFIVLCVIFAAWLVFLLVMYKLTTRTGTSLMFSHGSRAWVVCRTGFGDVRVN
jgi:hypothetical protein